MKELKMSTKDIRELIASYNEIRYLLIENDADEENIKKIDYAIERLKIELERRKIFYDNV